MTTNLMSASRNLMTRPADEHFASFAELRRAADRDDRNHREVETPVNNIEVVADVDGALAVGSKRAGKAYPMTHHSARAIARLTGGNSDFLFGRVAPKVAAIAMTDALSRTDGNVKLHLGTLTPAGLPAEQLAMAPTPVLRGVTTPSYTRVSDAAVLHEVNEWLLPVGFEAAKPTMNTDAQRNNVMGNNKPALFRGDRDLFTFFMFTETADGAGGRPVRRGVIVENSEVGASSVWVRRFVFDELCANFIIWGAREMQEFRAIHRGDERRILQGLRRELRELTPAVAAKELEVLRLAAEVTFADTPDTAVERLIKEFELSENAAKVSVMLASASENRGVRPLSFAGVANGVTSFAKTATNADQLVELATVGGNIYVAAGR